MCYSSKLQMLIPMQEDFIVVKRALEKEQIDEVIKISENYKDGEQ